LDSSGAGARDWLEQARFALIAADDFMTAGLFGQVITNAFLAMLYAARAPLHEEYPELGEWREVVQAFQAQDPGRLGLSNAGRRSLAIIARLYSDVMEKGTVEADPETAAACLQDAREFTSELERVMEPGED
jgi:urease accessory protein UreF